MKRKLIFLFLVCPIWAGLNAQVTICNQGLDEMKATTLQQDDIWVDPFTTYSQTPNIKKVSITDNENILEVNIVDYFRTFSPSAPITFGAHTVCESLYYPYEVMYKGGLITGLSYKPQIVDSKLKKNITIRIGETDIVEFPDNNGWVSPTKLTQVFSGNMDFLAGVEELYIPFDTPYLYNGKTLVIYVYHNENDPFNFNSSNMYRISYRYKPLLNRTYSVGDIYTLDPINPRAGYFRVFFPEIDLFIDVAGLGSISGVITDEETGEAIEKVEVKLADRMTTTSDTNGEYLFEHINFEEHEITLSKLGYWDKSVTVEVLGEEPTIQNITLSPISTYSVSGEVTDNFGNVLNGVKISIEGYSDYTCTTDISGNYSISGIYEGDFIYRLSATKQGYKLHQKTVNVIGDNVTYNIILEQLSYNIDVFAYEDEASVNINWTVPNEFTTFRYDSGVAPPSWVGFVGGNRHSVMGTTHRKSATLNKMSWFSFDKQLEVPITNFDLWVFGLDNTGMPDTARILFNAQNVPIIHEIWNEYIFPKPVEAPFGFYLAVSADDPAGCCYMGIGLSYPTEEYPFMYNTNLVNDLFSHPQYFFYGLEEAEPNPVLFNFVIRGEGIFYGDLKLDEDNSNGKTESFGFNLLTGEKIPVMMQNVIVNAKTKEINHTQQFPETSPNKYKGVEFESNKFSTTEENYRGLDVSYNIYRLKPGDDEENWILLDENVQETTFTDNLWATLPSGQYQYAIKAVYETGLSAIGISNVLTKSVSYYNVTFVVTDEDNNPIEDATIIFDGAELDKYTINVLAGDYPYSVSKEGYIPVDGTVTVEDRDVEQPVQLVAVGIRNNSLSGLVLYPNPFTNEININNPAIVKSVEINNIAGQKVKDIVFDGKSISTGKLAGGVYFVVVEGVSGGKVVYKMVKK